MLSQGQLLTLRKSKPVMKDRKKTKQATIFGSANGYFLKYSILPNRLGYWSAGRAKKPPNAGPKMLPGG